MDDSVGAPTRRGFDVATLFNVAYAPLGLTFIASVRRHAPDAHVWVLAVDQGVETLIRNLGDPQVHLITVDEIGLTGVDELRRTRTPSEFCWTLKPGACAAALTRRADSQPMIYADADTYLLRHPQDLVREFEESRAAVMVTRHDFSSPYDQTDVAGEFAANLLLLASPAKDAILPAWQDDCIALCSTAPSEGHFGDQRYLETWSSRFPGRVHVLERDGLLGSPWNIDRRDLSGLVSYNFHGLTLLGPDRVLLTEGYTITDQVRREIYSPYLTQLRASLDLMEDAGIEPVFMRPSSDGKRSLTRLMMATRQGRLADDSPYIARLSAQS